MVHTKCKESLLQVQRANRQSVWQCQQKPFQGVSSSVQEVSRCDQCHWTAIARGCQEKNQSELPQTQLDSWQDKQLQHSSRWCIPSRECSQALPRALEQSLGHRECEWWCSLASQMHTQSRLCKSQWLLAMVRQCVHRSTLLFGDSTSQRCLQHHNWSKKMQWSFDKHQLIHRWWIESQLSRSSNNIVAFVCWWRQGSLEWLCFFWKVMKARWEEKKEIRKRKRTYPVNVKHRELPWVVLNEGGDVKDVVCCILNDCQHAAGRICNGHKESKWYYVESKVKWALHF